MGLGMSASAPIEVPTLQFTVKADCPALSKGPVKLKVLHSTGRFGIKIVRICGKAKDRTFQYPIRDYPDAEDELDEGYDCWMMPHLLNSVELTDEAGRGASRLLQAYEHIYQIDPKTKLFCFISSGRGHQVPMELSPGAVHVGRVASIPSRALVRTSVRDAARRTSTALPSTSAALLLTGVGLANACRTRHGRRGAPLRGRRQARVGVSGHKEGRSALVVGGGVAGLATAAQLAKEGMEVTLFEKNSEVGGRCQSMQSTKVQGYRWDTGPSLLLLPQKYEDRRQPVAASGGSVSENSPFLVPNQVPSPDPRSPDQFGFGSNHSTWSETWWG
eukprot:g6717.t1